MSAFGEALGVESEGQRILLPWLRKRYDHVVVNAGGRLALELQQICDAFANKGDGFVAIEMKFEQSNVTGNLFLESWSNRSRLTPGWMLKCDATLLTYYFIETDELYVLDLPKLRRWAFDGWRIAKYPEKCQSKRDQKNDTWGWCVPVADCVAAAGVRDGKYAPKAELYADPFLRAQIQTREEWVAEYGED